MILLERLGAGRCRGAHARQGLWGLTMYRGGLEQLLPCSGKEQLGWVLAAAVGSPEPPGVVLSRTPDRDPLPPAQSRLLDTDSAH